MDERVGSMLQRRTVQTFSSHAEYRSDENSKNHEGFPWKTMAGHEGYEPLEAGNLHGLQAVALHVPFFCESAEDAEGFLGCDALVEICCGVSQGQRAGVQRSQRPAPTALPEGRPCWARRDGLGRSGNSETGRWGAALVRCLQELAGAETAGLLSFLRSGGETMSAPPRVPPLPFISHASPPPRGSSRRVRRWAARNPDECAPVTATSLRRWPLPTRDRKVRGWGAALVRCLLQFAGGETAGLLSCLQDFAGALLAAIRWFRYRWSELLAGIC
jgi:hypothetical protein